MNERISGYNRLNPGAPERERKTFSDIVEGLSGQGDLPAVIGKLIEHAESFGAGGKVNVYGRKNVLKETLLQELRVLLDRANELHEVDVPLTTFEEALHSVSLSDDAKHVLLKLAKKTGVNGVVQSSDPSVPESVEVDVPRAKHESVDTGVGAGGGVPPATQGEEERVGGTSAGETEGTVESDHDKRETVPVMERVDAEPSDIAMKVVQPASPQVSTLPTDSGKGTTPESGLSGTVRVPKTFLESEKEHVKELTDIVNDLDGKEKRTPDEERELEKKMRELVRFETTAGDRKERQELRHGIRELSQKGSLTKEEGEKLEKDREQLRILASKTALHTAQQAELLRPEVGTDRPASLKRSYGDEKAKPKEEVARFQEVRKEYDSNKKQLAKARAEFLDAFTERNKMRAERSAVRRFFSVPSIAAEDRYLQAQKRYDELLDQHTQILDRRKSALKNLIEERRKEGGELVRWIDETKMDAFSIALAYRTTMDDRKAIEQANMTREGKENRALAFVRTVSKWFGGRTLTQKAALGAAFAGGIALFAGAGAGVVFTAGAVGAARRVVAASATGAAAAGIFGALLPKFKRSLEYSKEEKIEDAFLRDNKKLSVLRKEVDKIERNADRKATAATVAAVGTVGLVGYAVGAGSAGAVEAVGGTNLNDVLQANGSGVSDAGSEEYPHSPSNHTPDLKDAIDRLLAQGNGVGEDVEKGSDSGDSGTLQDPDVNGSHGGQVSEQEGAAQPPEGRSPDPAPEAKQAEGSNAQPASEDGGSQIVEGESNKVGQDAEVGGAEANDGVPNSADATDSKGADGQPLVQEGDPLQKEGSSEGVVGQSADEAGAGKDVEKGSDSGDSGTLQGQAVMAEGEDVGQGVDGVQNGGQVSEQGGTTPQPEEQSHGPAPEAKQAEGSKDQSASEDGGSQTVEGESNKVGQDVEQGETPMETPRVSGVHMHGVFGRGDTVWGALRRSVEGEEWYRELSKGEQMRVVGNMLEYVKEHGEVRSGNVDRISLGEAYDLEVPEGDMQRIYALVRPPHLSGADITHSIKSGDTLSGIVREELHTMGVPEDQIPKAQHELLDRMERDAAVATVDGKAIADVDTIRAGGRLEVALPEDFTEKYELPSGGVEEPADASVVPPTDPTPPEGKPGVPTDAVTSEDEPSALASEKKGGPMITNDGVGGAPESQGEGPNGAQENGRAPTGFEQRLRERIDWGSFQYRDAVATELAAADTKVEAVLRTLPVESGENLAELTKEAFDSVISNTKIEIPQDVQMTLADCWEPLAFLNVSQLYDASPGIAPYSVAGVQVEFSQETERVLRDMIARVEHLTQGRTHDALVACTEKAIRNGSTLGDLVLSYQDAMSK